MFGISDTYLTIGVLGVIYVISVIWRIYVARRLRRHQEISSDEEEEEEEVEAYPPSASRDPFDLGTSQDFSIDEENGQSDEGADKDTFTLLHTTPIPPHGESDVCTGTTLQNSQCKRKTKHPSRRCSDHRDEDEQDDSPLPDA